ncbi:hypothetical protein VCHA54P486_510001 [Vibrio chagasii]|nr:hypothetical protein VCHA36P166_450001 [Vibrio chagasii]CAH7302894.1 hypothetical protein VCHA54P495_490006 [Vibrio chagasii]CAH7464862.1 hypothetical protein VCHA54P486_510001 [Vibrio chagasii]
MLAFWSRASLKRFTGFRKNELGVSAFRHLSEGLALLLGLRRF